MCSSEENGSRRVEIDTSAPFESVKEAVSRFGGVGYWKPSSSSSSSSPHSLLQGGVGETNVAAQVEEQARVLEKELVTKEKETLDVLKELEATKTLVGDLKALLQKQSFKAATLNLHSGAEDGSVSPPSLEDAREDLHQSDGPSLFPSSVPGLILMELKQAKLNLSKTTNDLVGIRASVESLNKKLDKESVSLEKARGRLTHNCSKIASLEEELAQAKLKLDQVKEAGANGGGGSGNALDVTRELQRLGCEAELFKKMGEVAKSEVLKTVSEIQQTKTRIKTAEIRLVAARKMKEAARAAESMALADIKALSSHQCSSVDDSFQGPSEGVTLTSEEYSALISKAREAEERSRAKVMEAMALLDEENASQTEILKRVEETAEEVKISKKALEEALNRVEAANTGKLAVEEALRKWRWENGQRRRSSSVQNYTKFKNPCPTQLRRDSYLRDVNGGPDMVKQTTTLSIGQILSRKLLVPEESEEAGGGQAGKGGGGCLKRKVSLGQMLSKRNGGVALPSDRKAGKENCNKQLLVSGGKRRKFGFARISHILSKQDKKKKKPTPDLR